MKINRIICTFALMALAVSASAAGKSEAAKAAKPGDTTITQLVVNDPNFDILQAAVVQAGLDGVLDGRGQYTVFAPTDDAFTDWLGVSEAEAIEAIGGLSGDYLEAVINILLFHVTGGRHTSTSVLAAPAYEMLNGLYLSQEQLLEAGLGPINISASNGIVHVINQVLIPSNP
jgi:uncharacterized surface protein with fasciclin (FAS1) repeats